MRAFTYHVPVPPDQTKIEYPDVRMDQGKFDYEALLSHWQRAACRVAATPFVERGWIGVDAASPMYCRVVAMAEFVDHNLDQPTVFLDSDAFLNADIRHIFDGDWDIGVTYREG